MVLMKSKITLFVFSLVLGAAQHAAAEDHPDVVYQKALLARSLPDADRAICDEKGAADKTVSRDGCHVTRLFISDINAGREKGFPPMTDIKFAVSKAEKDKIMDRM